MKSLEKHIIHYFTGRAKLSKQELVSSIKKDFPEWSDNTINMYLSKLRNQKVLDSLSRGFYTLDTAPSFSPNISNALTRIYKKLKRKFPYITFCIWDTAWLSDFMRHQPFKHYVILEIEKDAVESVFTFLVETHKNVFINPDEEIFNRYIHNHDEVLIVKNMVSEAPLLEKEKIVIPALEKLLVDMLIDTALFSAQQNEKEFIMQTAMGKHRLNKLKMRRYATRRNREQEVDELININLAE